MVYRLVGETPGTCMMQAARDKARVQVSDGRVNGRTLRKRRTGEEEEQVGSLRELLWRKESGPLSVVWGSRSTPSDMRN